MEIESIRKMLARAADTGHSNQHNTQGSTSFWMCKVRCWRWFFGNQIPISLDRCQLWVQVRGFRVQGSEFRDTHVCRLENCQPTQLSHQLCVSSICIDTDNYHITIDTVTRIAVRVTRGRAGIRHWARNSLEGLSAYP